MTQKYTSENGIRRYNPAWSPSETTTAAAASVTAAPFVNQTTALAVATAIPSAPPADAVAVEEEPEISFVPTMAYGDAVTKYHEEVEPEILFGGHGGDGDGDGLDELNGVLAKYEVPAGMLSKLLELKRFEVAEIIVDDSGSMRRMTDARDPNGRPMSRWIEAKWRISQMVELLAYVPCPPLSIYFLNRTDVLVLQRNEGESPRSYIQRAEGVLIQAFGRDPYGSTPALEAIQASLNRNPGHSVLRYFMGDGQPNGGQHAIRRIQQMITTRPNPGSNPFTFMSCTNEDSQVEWMKTTEERAPYCAEFDDYLDESREVLKDQGKAFPYSFGLHLVAQIVAAFCPHDLDAMDESVPFTRRTLDDLLGYKSSREEYLYYFDSFREAQFKLRAQLQPYQRTFVNQLTSLYEQFESAAKASDIPAVKRYKEQMRANPLLQQYQNNGVRRGTAGPKRKDCCIS